MSELVIAGRVASMADGATEEPVPGRVWIRDGRIDAVTSGTTRVAGFTQAPEVDVGDAFVLPGFIDMHNHLAYNALPLWAEPGRTEPWLHNKHWPDADTYTESITEPAWVYAKACPEALLGYVQVRAMAGGATAVQGWPTANRGYRTVIRNVDSEDAGTGRRRSHLHVGGDQDRRRAGDRGAPHGRRLRVHLPLLRGAARIAGAARLHRPRARRRASPDASSASTAARSTPANWAKWAANDAGGVVWSPLSNLVLYAQTTLIDDVRARGVRVCLGSDWGPSGTKNLLGEMKVARIAADQFGYAITDADIVEMVTSNPGMLLERCWHRPVGRLVKGGVRRRHRRPRPRPRQALEAHRRRDRARRRAGGHRRRPPIRRRQADERRPERHRRSR